MEVDGGGVEIYRRRETTGAPSEERDRERCFLVSFVGLPRGQRDARHALRQWPAQWTLGC